MTTIKIVKHQKQQINHHHNHNTYNTSNHPSNTTNDSSSVLEYFYCGGDCFHCSAVAITIKAISSKMSSFSHICIMIQTNYHKNEDFKKQSGVLSKNSTNNNDTMNGIKTNKKQFTNPC